MTVAKDLEILNDDLEADVLEDVIFPPGDLLSDEPPLENELHLRQLILLIQCLEWLWRDRQDFYALFVYLLCGHKGDGMTRVPSDRRDRNRDVTINIRAQSQQRDLIDRAATAVGKNRSDFMLETAYREAVEILLERRLFLLDDKQFSEFMALLDAPPSNNENLRQVLTTRSPWD